MENNTKIIQSSEKSVLLFLDNLNLNQENLKNKNLIIDISTFDTVTNTDIKLFLNLSKAHKKLKKSFVIVAKNIDYNKVPVTLTVVPTLQEAKDCVELEEIERDLGF